MKQWVKVKRILPSEKGITLVEILAAITILALIAIPLIAVSLNFTQIGSRSEEMLDMTYVAQTQVEDIYNLSTQYSFPDGIDQLKQDGFTEMNNSQCDKDYCYVKNNGDHYLRVDFQKKDENVTDILVRVYGDRSMDKLEAQMERLVMWKEDKGTIDD